MKKPRSRARTKTDAADVVDEASACCRHIASIARLMQACGQADLLTVQSITQIGEMLVTEAETLHESLARFPRRIRRLSEEKIHGSK